MYLFAIFSKFFQNLFPKYSYGSHDFISIKLKKCFKVLKTFGKQLFYPLYGPIFKFLDIVYNLYHNQGERVAKLILKARKNGDKQNFMPKMTPPDFPQSPTRFYRANKGDTLKIRINSNIWPQKLCVTKRKKSQTKLDSLFLSPAAKST